MCAATRANFWLRMVRAEDSLAFAERHDDRVWDSLRAILGTPAAPVSAKVLAHLPLSMGGLGLTSAVRTRVAAHWASWADSISMVRKRHPTIADAMIEGIDRNPAPCFQSVRNCEHVLAEAGLPNPSWIELAATPPSAVTDPEPTGPKFGRQLKASRHLQEKFHLDVVWPSLSDSERAMLRSQHGPLASAALTALPTSGATKIAAQPFRLLLCRTSPSPIAPFFSHLPMWPPTPTCLATIAQRARKLGVWVGGVSPSSALQHRCAGRQERGSRPTFSSWFFQRAGRSKTGGHCGRPHSVAGSSVGQ